MIQAKEQKPVAASGAQVPSWHTALAVSLMSFAALLLELGLTRLFSVVLFYHFAFLAISVALLGLGAGAVFAYLKRSWLQRWSIARLGTTLCMAEAIAIVAVLEVVLRTPVSLHLDWSNFLHLTLLYLSAAVAVLRYRAAVLDRFCAASFAHHSALWRRSARWRARLSGTGAAAEFHWRT